eukprot:SM000246S08209  [mRNA]  locus=s246:168738:169529:+ [translate_table: standard]
MILPLRPAAAGAAPEWAAVELQGSLALQHPRAAAAAAAPALSIGALRPAPGSPGKVLLTIGYHELEGAWVDLLKPLVVLRKQTAAAAAAPAGGALPDDDARRPPAESSPDEHGRPTASGSTQYVVAGIIRRKLLFKDRPKALISKPAQSSAKRKADHAVAIEVEKDLNGNSSQALLGQVQSSAGGS